MYTPSSHGHSARGLTGVLAQRGVGLVEEGAIGQRPDNRQVVRAGAAEPGAAFELIGGQCVGVQAVGQVDGDFLQHLQVADMLGDCRCQVVTLEVEAGAQGVLAERAGAT